MASRLALCAIVLLASCGTTDAMRKKVANHQQAQGTQVVANSDYTALKAIDQQKLTQMLNLGVGLITALITAFSEEPADYEYAFDTFSIQGWKLIKLFVPEEDHNSDGMKNAKKAWDEAFGGATELAELIQDAVKSGDNAAIIHSVVSTVDLALRTCSQAMPKDALYFDATADLVKELSASWIEFSTKLGWLKSGASLAQVDSVVSAGVAPEKLSNLLTTGVGIVTAMISAFSESPPDFEYAFDSLNLQGWKMVKTLVPAEDQKSDGMKRAKKAWDKVFGNAAEIAEEAMKAINDGDRDAVIRSILTTVDTALQTCAEVWVEDEVVFKAVAELIQGTSGSLLKFSKAIGWM